MYTSLYIAVHGEDALERGSRSLLSAHAVLGAHIDSMQYTKRLGLVCTLRRRP
jgi:hypothetical protein